MSDQDKIRSLQAQLAKAVEVIKFVATTAYSDEDGMFVKDVLKETRNFLKGYRPIK